MVTLSQKSSPPPTPALRGPRPLRLPCRKKALPARCLPTWGQDEGKAGWGHLEKRRAQGQPRGNELLPSLCWSHNGQKASTQIKGAQNTKGNSSLSTRLTGRCMYLASAESDPGAVVGPPEPLGKDGWPPRGHTAKGPSLTHGADRIPAAYFVPWGHGSDKTQKRSACPGAHPVTVEGV